MRLLWFLALAGLAVGYHPAPRVSTVAGTGVAGYSGDRGIAAEAQLNNPYGITFGPDGALYICDVDNHVIRRLDLRTRVITTVAGNGRQGFSGEGGLATDASLNQPYEVKFDPAGNLFFVEVQNHAIRRVDARTRRISTVAGTGTPGFSGDGGPALRAQLRAPHCLAFDPAGRLLVCDIGNNRVRRIDLRTGVIETFAGTGDRRPTPDGAPLEGTPLNGPRVVEVDRHGNLYIVLREGNQVLRLDARTNRYSVIAGTGQRGYAGDGGPAVKAQLSGPKGMALGDAALFLADTESHVVRKVDLRSGVITTLVGNGERGDGPDGDPAKCRLARPHAVAVDGRGLLLIADSENHRIREWRDLHASPVTMSPGPGVKSVPLTPRPPAAQPPAPLSPPPGNGAGAGAGAAGGALSPQFRKPGAAGR